jgi:hypothetical protein
MNRMRRLLVLAFLVPLACREPAHIDLAFSLSCNNATPAPASGGNPSTPQCGDMLLDCANFLEVRLYESNSGNPGNLLSSRCIPMDSLGTDRPTNLCDLSAPKSGFQLLSDLPEGKSVLFRMRALYVLNAQDGCNDDLPGQTPPVLVFDGFSSTVPIDGASHVATIAVSSCGSCRDLPVACNDPTCPSLQCLPGQTPVQFPGSNTCCAVGCKVCNANDPTCTNTPTCGPNGGTVTANCPPTPPICPDGQPPLTLPNCCKECGMPTTVGGGARPDGGAP